MIKYLVLKFNSIGILPMTFFKLGATVVIGALCGICAMCYDEAALGSTGMELYYVPMLEYILASFIIFWGGTLLLDIAEKERSAGK